jgi:NADPH:quinone reductase-like Zn-dependent oxidoreductase
MKAVVYTRYGPPDRLQMVDIEKPVPSDEEVLVRVYSASVNSWDWDMLRGKPFLTRLIGGLLKPSKKILGADIAGRVEATGAGVKHFIPGDEVFGDIAGRGFGGFAEYVCVPEKLLAKKSPEVSFNQAAALPQAGLLALQGLRYKGSLREGQWLLINGAAGGVGTLALQYAKSAGAVVTCVDLEEKFDLLRSLGADQLLDYSKEDYTRTGQQYDRILDVIAQRPVSAYRRALKPGGTFAVIGGSTSLILKLMILGPLMTAFGNKKLGLMGYRPNRDDLLLLDQLCKEGKVVPVIDKCYALHEVADAFRYFGTGRVRGKIVIRIADETQG